MLLPPPNNDRILNYWSYHYAMNRTVVDYYDMNRTVVDYYAMNRAVVSLVDLV